MEAFLLYNLKVALVLTVFYLFWRLCFRRLTLHRLSRAFLVGILPLSCLLPFCVRTFRQTLPLSTVTQVSDLFPQSHPLVAEVFNFQPLEHNAPCPAPPIWPRKAWVRRLVPFVAAVPGILPISWPRKARD